jgi:putative transposase
MLRVVVDESSRAELAAGLDELAREGARRMLAMALEAEVEAYIAAFADEPDDAGQRLVVRNGHAKPRQVTTVAGAIEVHAPRVDDRRADQATGQRCRFRSSILPPWCRRSPKVTEVLPLLYLHGLSSKDFVPALEEFFGGSAGLSASVVTRLTTAWQQEYRAFAERDLSGVDYVYVWVDGIHFKVRLDQDRCARWSSSERARTAKRNWSPCPTDTGSPPSPGPICCVTANVGACARRCWRWATAHWGFGRALREVFPQTRQQRDWVHKAANVLDALPKSAHPAARKALAEIRDAEDRQHAEKAITAFSNLFGTKHPKAVAKIVDDTEQLLAFYDFPAEHWVHLKTSNDRIHLRDRAAANQSDQGARQPRGRTGDGVQAH